MKKDSVINILPPSLSNKIAAGEVVERPASIVKELVENAIDAEATEITIIVKAGGTELIQIVDNGTGMSVDDVRLAFERHATSKITSTEDLEGINSLGFRGEALASIASVAMVDARSLRRGAEVGLQIKLDGGVEASEEPCGGNAGTSIAIKSLFFNTPARRKFLKADSTEFRHCRVVANRFALCYPDIHFTFVHNGEVIWDVRRQSMRERICAIQGKRLEGVLVEVNDDVGAVKINGFIGMHDTIRKNPGEQFIFLNGRYITDRSLNHAVISGYGEILAHGGYPFFALHLDIDPTRVDVNVHPTKMQVKFADDRLIYSLLRGAVKRSLASANVIPDFVRSKIPMHPADQWLRSDLQALGKQQQAGAAGQAQGEAIKQGDFFSGRTLADTQPFAPQSKTTASSNDDWLAQKPGQQENNTPEPRRDESGIRFETELAPGSVWQIHNKYLLAQVNTGLVIIDQHAAHERILYEKALALFEKRDPAIQSMLFPVMVELSVADFTLLFEIQTFLEKLGFVIKEFGKNTVVVEGVPSGLKIKDYQKVIHEMLDDFKRGKRENLEIRDNVAKIFACHSSIRAGDSMTGAEMTALISQLLDAETPYFCPHGRPVITKISLEELDKRFGRT